MADVLTSTPDEDEVEIVKSQEQWSTYVLADGTRLRVRPVVVEVLHCKGQYAPDGNPMYNIRSQIIVDVRAVKEMRKTP